MFLKLSLVLGVNGLRESKGSGDSITVLNSSSNCGVLDPETVEADSKKVTSELGEKDLNVEDARV